MQLKSLVIGFGILIGGVVALSGLFMFLEVREVSTLKASCLKNVEFKDGKELCDFLVAEFISGSLKKEDARRIANDSSLFLTDYFDVFEKYPEYLLKQLVK